MSKRLKKIKRNKRRVERQTKERVLTAMVREEFEKWAATPEGIIQLRINRQLYANGREAILNGNTTFDT